MKGNARFGVKVTWHKGHKKQYLMDGAVLKMVCLDCDEVAEVAPFAVKLFDGVDAAKEQEAKR